MKINYQLFIVTIILFNYTTVFCQLKKGDLLFDFSTSLLAHKAQNNQSANSYTILNSSPACGIMISNKMMIGGRLGFNLNNGYQLHTGKYSIKTLMVNPFGRHYFFEKNNWMPYVFLNTYFSKNYNDFDRNNIEKDGLAIFCTTGLGLNYFFTSNLAIEASSNLLFYENKSGFSLQDFLTMNIGLQMFLNNRSHNKANIVKRYLQKGNFILEGSLSFHQDDNNNSYYKEKIAFANPVIYELRILPNIKYFVTNKMALTINPTYLGRWSGSTNINNKGLNTGAQIYLPINEQLFIVPSFSIGGELRQTKSKSVYTTPIGGLIFRDTVETETNSKHLDGSLGLTLTYFSKGASIFSCGIGYSGSRLDTHEFSHPFTSAQLGLFLGMEYFFADNLSFSIDVAFIKYENLSEDKSIIYLPSDNPNNIQNLSFGINYYFFKKN